MAYEVFSPDWVEQYRLRINENEAYRQAAADWEYPLAFVLEANPALGLTEDKGVYLDLFHGECREARPATGDDLANTPYVIAADAYTWMQVIDGELDPLAGMMRARLKLRRGNLSVLYGYITAAKELVRSAQQVGTVFPEGVE